MRLILAFSIGLLREMLGTVILEAPTIRTPLEYLAYRVQL